MFYRGMQEEEVRVMGLEFVEATEEEYAYYVQPLGEGYWLEIYVEDGMVVDLQRCADF